MAEENENVQTEPMFQSWDGKPIYAKKAELDKNGNSLELTIEGDTVTAIGGKSIGVDSEIPGRSETDNAMLFSENSNTDLRWANWSSVTVSKKTENSVLIGKTWYPYVKIGNYYWTAENLREPIGTEGTDYMLYDANTLVERGYLYKYETILKKTGQDAEYTNLEESDALLALLHDGWHVPTINELGLLSNLEGGYDGGAKFFARDAFDIGGVTYTRIPTDNYGFKGYPSGLYSSDSNRILNPQNCLYIMSKTVGYNQQQRAWYLDLQPGSWTNTLSTVGRNVKISVRLCKSAT